MSARRIAVELSGAALRDVDGILLHTRRTWGKGQQTVYRAVIYQMLEMLSQHPLAGGPRDDLFPGCRGMQIEQHVIYYYQPNDTTIVVRRILHSRQDASAAVQDPGR
ncbi:MAG: type II toxin-antitoxin system RelE/ParE family toxin [Chloroflexia bacterium]|nr:type II toxin-antitoxin system RelE/ParE family toxin [Chloroflexia bacterium]